MSMQTVRLETKDHELITELVPPSSKVSKQWPQSCVDILQLIPAPVDEITDEPGDHLLETETSSLAT